MSWTRYVAVGDSFTEGLGDPDPLTTGGWRGWADRVAEALARHTSDFHYANLAIRGKLLGEIVAEQLPEALALRPDLVSISGGGNDLLRPGVDVDAIGALLDEAVGRVRDEGIEVIMFTGMDPSESPVIRRLRGRIAAYNEHAYAIAAARGAFVVDLWTMPVLRDWRMWEPDRLHMSPAGHRRVALAVLEQLGLPVEATSWREPLPPLPELRRSARLLREMRWARTYLVPWVVRRLRGQSSGDGLTAKRPVLSPLSVR
ncbi:MAG TPA: SGNH/GDSL hydrolase family protein [Streptosporangiaceae bacterium]|nr:SGNH/GDSL hydrolase family protein [Streptosporangiaceae bacterium]